MTDFVQEDDGAPRVKRVDRPDHPDRCSGVTSKGQCWVYKTPGADYCVMHGGSGKKLPSDDLYRLTKYKSRLKEMKDSKAALSLRNEIGILRITLEEILNKCQSAVDLMIHSSKISRLVQDIGKLVIDSKKLESGLGQLLDRQVVLALAADIVDVVAEVVDNPDQLAAIAKGIEAVIERMMLSVQES